MTTLDAGTTKPKPHSHGRESLAAETWRSLRRNVGAMIGLAIVVLLLLTAAFADIVAPHGPAEQFRDHLLQPPVWSAGGAWRWATCPRWCRWARRPSPAWPTGAGTRWNPTATPSA